MKSRRTLHAILLVLLATATLRAEESVRPRRWHPGFWFFNDPPDIYTTTLPSFRSSCVRWRLISTWRALFPHRAFRAPIGGTAAVRNATDSSLTATKGSGEGLNQVWQPSYTQALRAAAVNSGSAIECRHQTHAFPEPAALPSGVCGGQRASSSNRVCDPATASSFLTPESASYTVAYVSTCPYAITQRVAVGTRP